MKRNKGITLITLVITIIILLILAGVTIVATFGGNGIIKTTQNSNEQLAMESAKQYINKLLVNYRTLKEVSGIGFMQHFEMKAPEDIDYVIDNGDMTYIIAKDGFEALVVESELQVSSISRAGATPIGIFYLYRVEDGTLLKSATTKYREVIVTVKVTNKMSIGNLDEISVTSPDNQQVEFLDEVTGDGEISFIGNQRGVYVAKIKATLNGVQNEGILNIDLTDYIIRENVSPVFEVYYLDGSGNQITDFTGHTFANMSIVVSNKNDMDSIHSIKAFTSNGIELLPIKGTVSEIDRAYRIINYYDTYKITVVGVVNGIMRETTRNIKPIDHILESSVIKPPEISTSR